MELRHVELAGAEVGWHCAGAGPPLVLVHGLAGSWRWWRPVLPALARRFETHLVDLPRFGAVAGARPGDAADWLVRWLDAVGLVRPALVGHSLGGLLAAQVAARHPELPRRLVLTGPAGVPTGRSGLRETLVLASCAWTVSPRFLPVLAADVLRWGPPALLRGGLYALATDLRADLARIEAPTLLVWGERDRLVPARLGPVWRDAIPAARLAVIPGAAHVPMVERPSAFARAVLDFLEEAEDERGDAPGGGVVDGVRTSDDGDPPAR